MSKIIFTRLNRMLCLLPCLLLPAWGWAQGWEVRDIHGAYASDLAVDSAGKMFVISGSNIHTSTPDGNGNYGAYSAMVSGLNSPLNLAMDGANAFYVNAMMDGAIYKYAPDGSGGYTQSTVATGLNQPRGMAVDSAGNVFVSDTFNDAIHKYTLSSGSYSPSDVVAGFTRPGDLAVDGLGNVFVFSGGSIHKYRPINGGSSYVADGVLDSGWSNSQGIAADSLGNVYVADVQNGAVRKYTPNGSGYAMADVTTITGASAGVAVDRAGNIFFGSNSVKIRRAVARAHITLAGSGSPSAQGQNVTFTATVAPTNLSPAATGTVTFFDGATQIGTATLGSGQAALATGALAGGAHSITARYEGGLDNGGNTSAAVAQAVNYAITASLHAASPAGSGTFTCLATTVAPGASTTCTATPTAGYGLMGLTGCDTFDLATGTCTFSNVQANKTAVAQFGQFQINAAKSSASPAGASTFACAPAAVPPGGNTTCTATAASGHVLLALTGCDSPDLAAGTCTLSNVQANQAPVARFGLLLQGTTAPLAGAGGPASATVDGGGATCAFDAAGTGFGAAGATPPGKVAPQGTLRFKLIGCTPGATVHVTTVWPQPVADFTKHSQGAFLPASDFSISGSTVSFDVTDGGPGDDDGLPNGEIVDPAMPLAAAPVGAQGIPTLSEWAVLLLTALLGVLAWRRAGQDG